MTATVDEKQEIDPKLLWLTPDAALNFAHDEHSAQDPHATQRAKDTSTKVLLALDALDAEPSSRHGWFLAQMRSVIRSHANAMTRLKIRHTEECAAAESYRLKRSGQLNQAQQMKVLYQGVKKVAWIAAAGVLTFLGTKILALVGYVPDTLLNQQGHTDSYVSFSISLLAAVFVGLIQN